MGVLTCDRDGCPNIMCNLMSTCRRWYICDDCFEELVTLGPATDLNQFFNSEPTPSLADASRAYFETIFIEF